MMNDLDDLAQQFVSRATARKMMAATAESCTGGMVAAAITGIPGSSAVLDRGFVTYTNEAKADMLGVSPAVIDAHGAVSQDVAASMAAGAITHSRADIAVSITGIAGPTGGSATKPVGTVWFGVATRNGAVTTHHRLFDGDRTQIRRAATRTALQLLTDLTA